jgi:hypothetical protein
MLSSTLRKAMAGCWMPCTILWSADGMKCVLLINDYPHAVFDFAARRGYCRTNFPNSAGDEGRSWNTSDHQWKDDVMKWFTRPAR